MSEFGGYLCSHPTVVPAVWIHDSSKEVTCWPASGAVKYRTIKRLLPDERWNGSLVAEAHSTKCTGGRWRQSWDHSTRVATTRGSPSTSFRLIFDKCVERNCAQYPANYTHSHSADSWDQPTMVDFMNRFPDTFGTVTDSWPEEP